MGIEIETAEVLPSRLEAELRSGRRFDLAYRVLRCDEPVFEAGILLCPGYDAPPGAGALAATASPEILQLLLRLERASEWPTARGLAIQIDRESRDELPVIPLWQLVDHYAWRDRLKGPAESANDLYQGLETWEITPWIARDPWKVALRQRRSPVSAIGLCLVLLSRARLRLSAQAPAAAIDFAGHRVGRVGAAALSRFRFISGSTLRPGSTGRRSAALIREWQVLVRRFIGSPWVVTIAEPTSPLCHVQLDALEPDAFASVTSFDKVWVMRIAQQKRRLGAGVHGPRVRYGHAASRASSASDRVRFAGRSPGHAPVYS